MRIISQDRTIDTPYDLSMIWVREKYGYSVMAGMPNDEPVLLGKYSSREKAIKVMEMLREQYEKLEVFKVLACGTTEYMEKSLNYEEMVEYNQSYREMNVFQFPKDDEVEV